MIPRIKDLTDNENGFICLNGGGSSNPLAVFDKFAWSKFEQLKAGPEHKRGVKYKDCISYSRRLTLHKFMGPSSSDSSGTTPAKVAVGDEHASAHPQQK